MKEARLKQLNEQLGWIYGPSPVDGEKYWTVVKNEYSGPCILTATIHAVKGWTYEDGEHIGFDVIAYKKLQKPLFKV